MTAARRSPLTSRKSCATRASATRCWAITWTTAAAAPGPHGDRAVPPPRGAGARARAHAAPPPPAALANGFLDAPACDGTTRVALFVFASDTQALLVARLDNLGKGASGAAVQAMNVHLGVDEGLGLLPAQAGH